MPKVVTTRVSWWVMPCLNTLFFFCALVGYEPDTERVAQFIAKHGVKVTTC